MDGTPFGRYVLLELLGRGGMGEVWRAHDTEAERIVALKVLPTHLADDDTFQRRFRREARVAAGLYEPHVVPIHSYGEIDGRLYVDMRLIVGRDLETMLRDGPLEPARATLVIEQVAAALNAAHAVGLIHRDVKPSNILVTDSDFAYLIDFGISRVAGDTSLTNTGSTIGTWAYMAPERFGDGEPDPRSDIYALTCVLHQCLTGQRPFPGDSVEQQVAGHLTKPPPQPSTVNGFVPQAIDDVIAQGMAKNPDERYSSTVELARAARTAITTPTRHSTRPSPFGPTSIAPTWHAPSPVEPIPARATAHAFTQVRDLGGGPPVANPPAVQPIPTPELPKQSMASRGLIVFAILAVVVLVAGAVLMATQPWKDTSGPSPIATGPTTPPKPAGPTFDGTFTTAYGPQTKFNGDPVDGLVAPATWVVRSVCDRSGCVAAATTVDRPEGVLTRIFDFVDGRWLSVTEEPSRNVCTDQDSQRWERTSLQPRPDGSLVGDFASMYDRGCARTSPVTFSRTGDADPGVQTADLDAVPARVVSPAQGLRGKYHRVVQYTTGIRTSFERDTVAQTFCLRTGDRCLNYLLTGNTGYPLMFSTGQWTQSVSSDTTCKGGAPKHDEFSETYPLPQPLQDPIQVLAGRGENNYSGGCKGTQPYDISYTRTGD